LPREECDLSVIEKKVQDRIGKLRNYQISYPEEATEGMNRLAEAFITLAESCSKVANGSPRQQPAPPSPKPNAKGASITKDETAVISKTQLDWRAEPPPVRQPIVVETKPDPEFAETPQVITEEEPCEKILIAKPFAPPAKRIHRTVDAKLVRDLAEESPEATSNLATLDAVIERVDLTRMLLHNWDKLGKQFKCKVKKVSAKESETFAARLDKVVQVMQAYPAFLGHPGKPGYRVVVQARLRMPLAMVRGMSDEQREELLFDWQAGRQVLLAHRTYLRRLFRSMRHRTKVGLVLHAIRAVVNDHPLPTLLGTLVVVVVIIGAVCACR
jgi:hypothetical protein